MAIRDEKSPERAKKCSCNRCGEMYTSYNYNWTVCPDCAQLGAHHRYCEEFKEKYGEYPESYYDN